MTDGTRAFSIDLGAGPRRYLVYAPPAATSPLPVVLLLHGAGGTPEWTLDETRWDETADRERFLVVLPEGTRPDPTRPPAFLSNPPVWNDGPGRGLLGRSDADDVRFIDAVLDRVLADYPADPSRLYVTGFSNGGSMTFRLAAERSERFAALAPIAAPLGLPDPRPRIPRPTLYIIGAADPIIPLHGGRVVSPWDRAVLDRPPVALTLERWAAALDCPPTPEVAFVTDGVECLTYGPGRADVALTAYVVDGLGHHWPGGRGRLSKRLAGHPSDRLDANRLIWDFFRQYKVG